MLIETVVLLSVFGVLGATVAGATQTSFMAKRVTDAKATTENIIRNQVDYALSQPYRVVGSYKPITDDDAGYSRLPDGYTVTAVAVPCDEEPCSPDISKVRVTVSRDGIDGNPVPYRIFDTLRARR